MKSSLTKASLPALPGAALFLCLSLIPLAMLALFSFVAGNLSPGGQIAGFTLGNFARAFSSWTFPRLMGKSLMIGLLVTSICIVIAYPAAWALAKVVKERRRSLCLSLVIVPFFTSQLLLIYAIMSLFQSRGLVMTFFGMLNLADPSSSILYSNTAVVIVLVYEYLPYMILSLYTSLESIDDNLLLASRSLGAGKIQTFRRVVFPMSLPGLLSGILLVLVPTAGSFVEPELIGGADGMMVGSLINSQFSEVLNMGYGAALSFVFLVVLSGVMVIVNRWLGRAAGGAQHA